MISGQQDSECAQQYQSQIQNSSSLIKPIQNKYAIAFQHQSPIRTFITSQLDSDTINTNQKYNSNEFAIAQQNQQNVIYDKNYLEHRQFLNNYKRQRQQELLKQKKSVNAYQLSQSKSLRQKSRCYSMIQNSIYNKEGSDQQNRKYIIHKMNQIHDKIQNQIFSQDPSHQKHSFKLFTDIIQIKSDIGRVAKQKRFIKSQQSKHYEYLQPKIIKDNEYKRQFRIRTQGIYDQSQLSRQAQQFSDRIHKQQQVLLGNHLMRKKLEQKKRAKLQRQQIIKNNQINQYKRQERKLKAEENLMLMKHKAKISQLINHKNYEQLNHMISQQKEIYSNAERYAKNQQKQFSSDFKQSYRASIDKSKDFMQPKRWKLQNLKLSTTPSHLIQKQLNLRQKIASKKNRLFKQKIQYVIKKKENAQLDKKPSHSPLESNAFSSDIQKIKYRDSYNGYQYAQDQQCSLKRQALQYVVLLNHTKMQNSEIEQQNQQTQIRQKQESFTSMQ